MMKTLRHWWKKVKIIQRNKIISQRNLYENTHDIFHRTRTNSPKIYMEPQITLNYQRNLEEKKNKAGDTMLTWFQTILQNCCN